MSKHLSRKGECAVASCKQKIYSRRLCSKHYRQQRYKSGCTKRSGGDWQNRNDDSYFSWWKETDLDLSAYDEEILEDWPQYRSCLKKLIDIHQKKTINNLV